ncbi:sulfate ABC transporter permease subunit CysW [Anaeromyxobacter sp. Fw109-5]|uniref:sulfate ABC transporter permease subunit CysW n=1 Tax=Anaeromyxobacter sp. (strain Fw109-5) TaxID=404589 RepID=UPI0000ED7DE7|nr:sulfate ABC transporter permease subunit CysW [Anaeromyxobacter sp. Fw109-5]ABS25844.1 sulfate ABC transporter, inner membrane subunit CysW [Anaeromyxobacter sp. Fw109-5]
MTSPALARSELVPPAAASLPLPDAAGVGPPRLARPAKRPRRATEDPPWVRRTLVGLALLFIAGFVLVPAATVLAEALRGGVTLYWRALVDPDALAAVKLTLLVAAVAVPLNAVFGLAAAWSVTRFRYAGKSFLVSLIDLPFGVSPVISGMMTVLLFGAHGWLGPWLIAHDVKIVFAVPGIVLATVFVTFPFVARELIPFMEAQGVEEEEAALVLGASGWQILTRVTLPNVKWSLLYGVILCNARAMGEFGAVSVVSGHIRGVTNTLPLQVEILYGEYAFQAAFAVASLLFVLALVTLVAKRALEWNPRAGRRAVPRSTP